MNSYKYLIVGSGMTADAAVRGIRTLDTNGSIGMIGEEINPPYNRPPLSKGLWKGKPIDSIWRRTPPEGLTLQLGRKVVSLNANDRQVQDDKGQTYQGEKILLATGGTVHGTIELVERLRGQIVGLAFLVELLSLKGRERLQSYKTTSVIQY